MFGHNIWQSIKFSTLTYLVPITISHTIGIIIQLLRDTSRKLKFSYLEVYTIIYVSVCVCVNSPTPGSLIKLRGDRVVQMIQLFLREVRVIENENIHPTPSTWLDVTQGQYSKIEVKLVWIKSFPSPCLVAKT